jgi:hypothetical protein
MPYASKGQRVWSLRERPGLAWPGPGRAWPTSGGDVTYTHRLVTRGSTNERCTSLVQCTATNLALFCRLGSRTLSNLAVRVPHDEKRINYYDTHHQQYDINPNYHVQMYHHMMRTAAGPIVRPFAWPAKFWSALGLMLPTPLAHNKRHVR